MLKTLLSSFLIFFGCSAFASGMPQVLPVDQAYRLSVETRLDSQHKVSVLLHWRMAPGTYLYRDKLHFKVLGDSDWVLQKVIMPKTAMQKKVPGVGSFFVYHRDLRLHLPLQGGAQESLKLQIAYQGCTDSGICYPPVQKIIPLQLGVPVKMSDHVLLQDKGVWRWVVLFGFGLLMAMTPCVLPLLPVLLAMLVGQKDASIRQRFRLALYYVLGMSTGYVGVGVLFAGLGHYLQAWMQMPMVLLLFAVILLVFALSLFEVFHWKLPCHWTDRATRWVHQRGKASGWAALALGLLSILVLSPCTTPALVGVLTYMTQSGSFVYGGLGLFVLGLGAGTPLLLISVLGTEFLSKSQRWLVTVKYLLGVILLALAVTLVERAYPQWFHVGSANRVQATQAPHKLTFERVDSIKALSATLNQKAHRNKRVLIDVYADWCVTCLRIEREVFGDAKVQRALEPYLRLRVDVTHFDRQRQELLRHLGVVAPPTLLFLDAQHQEIPGSRLVGEVTVGDVLRQLK